MTNMAIDVNVYQPHRILPGFRTRSRTILYSKITARQKVYRGTKRKYECMIKILYV